MSTTKLRKLIQLDFDLQLKFSLQTPFNWFSAGMCNQIKPSKNVQRLLMASPVIIGQF